MNVSEKEMTRPKEKRAHQNRLSSSEGENAVSLQTIVEKLDILSQINERLGRIEAEILSKEKFSSFEKSLTSLNEDVEELKHSIANKAVNARVQDLEDAIEDLVNR